MTWATDNPCELQASGRLRQGFKRCIRSCQREQGLVLPGIRNRRSRTWAAHDERVEEKSSLTSSENRLTAT